MLSRFSIPPGFSIALIPRLMCDEEHGIPDPYVCLCIRKGTRTG